MVVFDMNRRDSCLTANLDVQRVAVKDGRIIVPTQGRVYLWMIVAPMVWSSLCSAGTLYFETLRLADVIDVTRFHSRASTKIDWHPGVLARYQEQDEA